MRGCPEDDRRRASSACPAALLAPALLLVGCLAARVAGGGPPPHPAHGGEPGRGPGQLHPGGTWSVVAVDRDTGDVGVAAASCLDYDVSALAALVPGRGAAVIQADYTLDHRNAALRRLQAGDTAAEVVAALVGAGDSAIARRQFGVVTMDRADAGVAGHSGAEINSTFEQLTVPEPGVAVQGNTLVDKQVVRDALAAFLSADEAGSPLAESLLAGLEAGSAAGGDFRCNTAESRQTAASAFVMVALDGQGPFVVRDLRTLESDWPERPWLHLSVVEEIGGPNPVTRLRREYEAWKAAHEEPSAESAPSSGAGTAEPSVMPGDDRGRAPEASEPQPRGQPSTGAARPIGPAAALALAAVVALALVRRKRSRADASLGPGLADSRPDGADGHR